MKNYYSFSGDTCHIELNNDKATMISIEDFEKVNEFDIYINASGALLEYIEQTQKVNLGHIQSFNKYKIEEFMILDVATRRNINLEEVNYISGGERRDWFFSLIIARLLDKPHITIYKDMACVVSQDEEVKEVDTLSGKAVLHIADLITEASSYERAWIPAISKIGGSIKWSVVVVDRKQGGEKVLNNFNVKSFAMVGVDSNLFSKALSMGMINEKQFDMIEDYIRNPKESMTSFLKQNPQFLKEALNSDDKTKERAKLMLDKGIYEL
jgi:orotate phosphoribosyltransferase